MSTSKVGSASKLPFGQSEVREWPGGVAIVTIRGTFITAGGVGTAVSLNSQARGDGKVSELAVYREPGKHRVAVPPGVYWFHASGPDGHAWSIDAKLEPKPRPPKSAPTLEDRVAALEARSGRRNLN